MLHNEFEKKKQYHITECCELGKEKSTVVMCCSSHLIVMFCPCLLDCLCFRENIYCNLLVIYIYCNLLREFYYVGGMYKEVGVY